jgi:hypothetical protein
MTRRNLVGLVWVGFQASILVGYGLAAIGWENPPTPPQPTVSTPSITPVASHRPGVTPWDCTPNPGPSCLSPPPTACPTKVDPGLEPFYPCLGRQPK